MVMPPKHIRAFFLTFCLIALLALPASAQSHHIKELDGLRNSMTKLGDGMSDVVKNVPKRDLRTAERVFEINTYALTTIEAYFKMIKVAVSSSGEINAEIVSVLNGWLDFMGKYCKKDIEYFDEALADTKDKPLVQKLETVTQKAIEENKNLIR